MPLFFLGKLGKELLNKKRKEKEKKVLLIAFLASSTVRERTCEYRRGNRAAEGEHAVGETADFALCPRACPEVEEVDEAAGIGRHDERRGTTFNKEAAGILLGDTFI